MAVGKREKDKNKHEPLIEEEEKKEKEKEKEEEEKRVQTSWRQALLPRKRILYLDRCSCCSSGDTCGTKATNGEEEVRSSSMRSSWASLRRDPRLLLVLAALVVVVGRLKGSGSSFSFVPFANAARSFARSSSATSSASSQQLAASGEAISTELLEHPKLLSLSRKDPSQPSVFIAIGSAPKKHELRDTVRATWLAHCKPPSCGYRFFTDDNYTLGDHLGGASPNGDGVPADVVTTPADEGGYAHFGIRALQQMEWSLRHVDFDHYLRLDDDGMLCVDHLMHDLKQLPLTRLFWGKYWCQHMVRVIPLHLWRRSDWEIFGVALVTVARS